MSNRLLHPGVSAKSPHAGTVHAVTKDLVAACGGVRKAAAVTSVRKTSIALYADTNNAPPKGGRKISAPVSVVLDMERHVRQPIVTRYLAAELGYVLVKMDQLSREATLQSIAELNVGFAEQACEVLRDGVSAIEGEASREGLVVWRDRLRKMMSVAAQLDCAVSSRIDPPRE